MQLQAGGEKRSAETTHLVIRAAKARAIANFDKAIFLEHLVELYFCHAVLADVGVVIAHSRGTALLQRRKYRPLARSSNDWTIIALGQCRRLQQHSNTLVSAAQHCTRSLLAARFRIPRVPLESASARTATSRAGR